MSSSEDQNLGGVLAASRDSGAPPDAAFRVDGRPGQLNGSRFLRSLHRIVLSLARPAEASSILQVIVDQARALADADGAFLALSTSEDGVYQVRATSGSLRAADGELIPVQKERLLMHDASECLGQVALLAGTPVAHGSASDAVVFRLGSEEDVFGFLALEGAGLRTGTRDHKDTLMREYARVATAVVENVRRFATVRSGEQKLAWWRETAAVKGWNDRYEKVLEGLGVAVFEWDSREDRIVWGNSSETRFGFPSDRFHRGKGAFIESFHPEDRQALWQATATLARHEGDVDMLVRIRDGNDGIRPVRFRMVPGPNGTPHYLGILAEEPSHPSAGAEEAARKIIRFLQHEVNNPLAVIMGETQLMLAHQPGDPLDPEIRRGLEAVLEEGRRIADVVQKISDGEVNSLSAGGDRAVLEATAATSDSASGFRSIVESLGDGVVVVDVDHVVRYANPGVKSLVGESPAALIGRTLGDVLDQIERADELERFVERTLDQTTAPVVLRGDGAEGDFWFRIGGVPFRSPDGGKLGALLTITDVTAEKLREARIREEALQDELTGLPTRAVLIERLNHALARARRHEHHQFAILFLDCDHLKLVNDSFGHAAGDALLVNVTERLQRSIRPEDTLARLGGDEFCILLEGIKETADATRVAERILQDVAQPFPILGFDVKSSVSIGIVLSGPDYEKPDQLLHDADMAMYRAKTVGRGSYEIFDREMHQRVTSRLHEEAELRNALERSEFRLVYQPVVSLSTQKIVGLEALLRWVHPERGLVQPADFIPVAEQANLMLPIGQWVLSTASHALRAWKTNYPERAPEWISVNLSSKQFLQPGLVAQIRGILREASLRPDELRLEIQETAVSQNSKAASAILAELSEIGVRINMDDFGTGYSSISGLSRLNIEALKIDQSFVQTLRSSGTEARLVRTILRVAEGVGAATIAEGVSTVEQLGALQMMGCQYAQGYLFFHPLDARAIERLLQGEVDGRGMSLPDLTEA